MLVHSNQKHLLIYQKTLPDCPQGFIFSRIILVLNPDSKFNKTRAKQASTQMKKERVKWKRNLNSRISTSDCVLLI